MKNEVFLPVAGWEKLRGLIALASKTHLLFWIICGVCIFPAEH